MSCGAFQKNSKRNMKKVAVMTVLAAALALGAV